LLFRGIDAIAIGFLHREIFFVLMREPEGAGCTPMPLSLRRNAAFIPTDES